MEYIDSLESSFQTRLSQIFELSRLPLNILSLLKTPLDSINNALDKIDGSHSSKNIISNNVRLLANLSKNQDVQQQFRDFNSQIIVLMVGAMEAHLYDVVKAIGDNNPEMFVFSSSGSKPKVITFDASLLDDKTSVGEIMRHYFKEKDGDVSFQDVQSIVRFYADKLSCGLEIDDYQDILIFATSARNVIVHNNQIIDKRFLNQIRDTPYIDMATEDDEGKRRKRFTDGEKLAISDADINEVNEALLSLVAEVSVKIRENYESKL